MLSKRENEFLSILLESVNDKVIWINSLMNGISWQIEIFCEEPLL